MIGRGRGSMVSRRWVAALIVPALVAACAPVETDGTDPAPGDGVVSTSEASTPPSSAVVPDTAPPVIVAAPDPIPIEAPDGMELVWHDEFDGEMIDRANWTFDIGGWGWGNGEAQYYTDRPENARIENGVLVIEARQEKYENSYYTSARLKTQGLQAFQYGRIEARIRVPKGVGTWPAFWMLGHQFEQDTDDPAASQWPNVGEIDIMEYVGREPDLVMGTVHGPGYAGAGGLTRWNRQDYDIGDDFHTFAIDWDADGIRWLYDGEVYNDLGRDGVGDRTWVFDQPFFIIVNLAIGGTLGGTIALDTEFPQYLYVDHVRVYQTVASGD